MKTNLDLFGKKEVEINIHYTQEFTGYGHKKVTAIVDFEDNSNVFKTISTDTQFFDNLDKDQYEQWDGLFHGKFFDDVKEQIAEWVCDVIEEKEGKRIF